MSGPAVEEAGRSWLPRRIHHVAFAHAGPEVLEGVQRVFGLECALVEEGPGFVERLFPVGDGYLQTLECDGPGVVEKFIGRRGSALHHVAFEVGDIDAALEDLRTRGTRLVDRHARHGGGDTRIAFIHPSECGGLLVELVEASVGEG